MGQVAGSIHGIKSAKDIVDELVMGAVHTLNNIAAVKKVHTAKL